MAGRLIIRSTLRQLGRKRRTVAVATTTKQDVAYNNYDDNMSALLNQQRLFSTVPSSQKRKSDINNNNNNNSILPKPTTIRLSERLVKLGLIKSIKEAEEMIKDMKINSLNTDRTISTGKGGRAKQRLLSENNRQYIYIGGCAIMDDIHVSTDAKVKLCNDIPIRLSKRMSELGICSRREAAAILKNAQECGGGNNLSKLDKVIHLHGKPVTSGAAVKVSPKEKLIQIRNGNDATSKEGESKEFLPYSAMNYHDIMGDTIVLNKPLGYVSGQEEHQHTPAVRLLNRDNMYLDDFDEDTRKKLETSNVLHFDRWKFKGHDLKANSIPKRIRDTLRDDDLTQKSTTTNETLTGYAPAGRLDLDSTGLLIFTKAGIMARRIIEPKSNIEKEYIVKVQPAVKLSNRELEKGLKGLPHPSNDLTRLLRSGNRLVQEPQPLKPLVVAEWIDNDDSVDNGHKIDHRLRLRTMRLVLKEGKKRQIRRMCRELLGWHVVDLKRISVGPIKIGDLPEGQWRPLTKSEVLGLFNNTSSTSKAKTKDSKSKKSKRNRYKGTK